ncbi:hypothetical protein GIB67_035400 [Kingdonia uniflora]|uniref:Helicase C-terminal domain-containing protein n=1 Tax=Kingdonia uniflora TaxID=39325 RepID=A0A7J7P080_9MAGN|nr:hypothetical protein GIB67_035400 [Kingdonia uniflora]
MAPKQRTGTKSSRSDNIGILDGQRVGANPAYWAMEKGFKDRPFVKEQVVDIKSISEVNDGYARVFAKFKERNWTKILTSSGKVYPRIVRLFYATLQLEHIRTLYSRTFSVTIDGSTYTVTRDSIYAILGFRSSQCIAVPRCIWPASYYPWPAITSEGEFEEDGVPILHDLHIMVIDITAQYCLYTGSGIVSKKMLDDEFRLVHNITITNIVLRSQKNELSERMKVFLYAFMNDIEIDLPNVILEEMIDASTKMATRSSLPFARLIMAILTAAGYKIFPNEPEDTKTKKLDASNCHKSASHLPSVLPSAPVPPGEHIGSSSSAAQPQEVFSILSIRSMLQTMTTKLGDIEGRLESIEEHLETLETEDFQEDGAPIFLLTSQVGGLGLTLTKADCVIVVDPAWNPSVDVEGGINFSGDEDDIELDKQLKLLNNPVVKTIKTEHSAIFDCVDIYKQPAFSCEGRCMRSFHALIGTGADSHCNTLGFSRAQLEVVKKFLCLNCRYKIHTCYACGKLGSSDKSSGAEIYINNDAAITQITPDPTIVTLFKPAPFFGGLPTGVLPSGESAIDGEGETVGGAGGDSAVTGDGDGDVTDEVGGVVIDGEGADATGDGVGAGNLVGGDVGAADGPCATVDPINIMRATMADEETMVVSLSK